MERAVISEGGVYVCGWEGQKFVEGRGDISGG